MSEKKKRAKREKPGKPIPPVENPPTDAEGNIIRTDIQDVDVEPDSKPEDD